MPHVIHGAAFPRFALQEPGQITYQTSATLPTKLSRIFPVRFHPDVYAQLEKRAREVRRPVGAVIREACEVALDLPPQQPPSRSIPDMSLLNQLARIGNNLNQQTRTLHQLRHRELAPDFDAFRRVLEEVQLLLEQVSAQVAEANS